MTPWQQTFQNQKFLEKLDSVIAAFEGVSLKGLAKGDIEKHQRLLKVLKFARARLKLIDPELTSQTVINNLGAWISNIHSQAQSFASSRSPGNIQAANTAADSIVDVVRSFRTSARDNEEATATVTTSFREKAIEEIETVRSTGKEVRSDLTAVRKDLAETKGAIEQQKGRLDQSIAEFQKQFSQAEADRAKEFAASASKLSEQVTAQVTEFRTQFEADAKDRKEKGDEHLAFLKERQKEVDEIFGAIGAASLAGDFKKTADQQKSAADRFRWLALALMLATVGVAGVTFYHTLNQPTPDWRLFGFRFATSLVFLIPALYAARESAKHRARESRLRKSHLELASIDAYLALLPENKRNEIKEKLTDKFFGQTEPVEKDEMVTGHALLNIIEIAMKNLTSGK